MTNALEPVALDPKNLEGLSSIPVTQDAQSNLGSPSIAPVTLNTKDIITEQSNAQGVIKLTPTQQKEAVNASRYYGMLQSSKNPFESDNPSADDIGYASWLRDNGYINNSGGQGFLSTLGNTIVDTFKGTGAIAKQAYQFEKARFTGTEQDKANAQKRDDMLSANYAESLKAQYEYLATGSKHLAEKGINKVFETLANLEDDPAFKAQVKQSDDASWYNMMRSFTKISSEQKLVHDYALNQVLKAGESKQDFETSTTAATFVGDPLQYALGPVMKGIGKGISMAAKSVGVKAVETASLGAADALRAEISLEAPKIAQLQQTVTRLAALSSDEAVATHEVISKDLETALQKQADKQVALTALDKSNSEILSKAGQPSIAGKIIGGTVRAAGSGVEQAGKFLSEFNQGVVDKVLSTAGEDAPNLLGQIAKKYAPTALTGGVIGAASDDENRLSGFFAGAAAGAATPSIMSNAGRLARIMGENYLIGRTAIPYFAKMSSDAEANGLEKWAFRKLDTFNPAIDFAINTTKAATSGAATGAAFGYVASGGEDNNLSEAAASGVAGHITPWAMISSLHSFWSPVSTPTEYQNMRASNLRLLQDRWNGSENISRLNKLTPSQQLDVASIISSNPDTILRLIGTDDTVIKADQLAKGLTPADVSKTPGMHYQDPVTGRSVIVLNPSHPDSMMPVLAHEFWHKAQSEGLGQSLVTELIGDKDLGVHGLFTKLDENGQPVRRADGSFDTTKEFQDAKSEYEKRLTNNNVNQTLSDSEFALEHAAEQGADFVMSSKFEDAIRPTIGSLIFNALPESLRNAVGSSGAALNSDESVKGSMGLGLKYSPSVEKLFNSYMENWRLGRNKSTVDAGSKSVEISREQILRNPDILKAFLGTSSVNIDSANGKIAGTKIDPATGKLIIIDPKKVFKSTSQIAKEQADLTDFIINAVKNAKDVADDKNAVKVTAQNGREVAMGKYLSDETVKTLEASGKFNQFQLDHIKNINALTKGGTGDYVRFFYQPALKNGKYGSLAGHWREEVPYSWHISKADNVLFRTISYDKVSNNLQKLWSKNNDRATSLWSSQVSMLEDSKTYLENLSQGKAGETDLSNSKKDFINLALGINTKERSNVNPLYDISSRNLESFLTGRRVDRTSRVTSPERSEKIPWSYEAYTRGKLNMTAGEASGFTKSSSPENRGVTDIKPQQQQTFEAANDQPKSDVVGYTPTNDIKNVPEISLKDLIGKKVYPILADLTAVGKYKGINTTAVVPVNEHGGPQFPLIPENQKAGVVWANEGKGMTTRNMNLINQTDGYAIVTAMSQDAHASNSTTVQAYINTLKSYVEDGRVNPKGIKEADNAIKHLGVDLPSISDPLFGNAVRDLSFESRKNVISQLERAKFEDYGFPPAKRVLDEVRSSEYHGVDFGDGLLVLKLDPQNTVVKLGEEGTPTHPDYTYGVRGQIIGKLKRPIPSSIIYKDFFEQRRAENKPISSDYRALQLKLPVAEITPEKATAAERLENTSATNATQLRAALSASIGDWSSSDQPVNKGGVSPAEFARALKENKSAASLTPYTENMVKEKIKSGDVKIYKLKNAEIYFSLEKNDSKVVLQSVINNEPGAKGVATPAVLSKAIELGATHLDCFAVQSKKYPDGFLPELYSQFGFVEDGMRNDFDRKIYDSDWEKVGENPDKKFADLEKMWQSDGWDKSTKQPQFVSMRLLDNLTSNDSRQNFRRELLNTTEKTLARTFDDGTESANISFESSRNNSGNEGFESSNTRKNSGSEGDLSGLHDSFRGRSIEKFRELIKDLVNLTDDDAKYRGIDIDQLHKLKESLNFN